MNNVKSGGIGFFGMLTILFIALKLTNVITWPWIWVFAPVWIPLVFWIVVIIGIYQLFK